MRKILSILILGILFASCYNTGEPRKNVLKIYNWADYIGEGVLEDFQVYYKEQTGRYPYCLSDIRYQRNHAYQD